MKYVLKYFLLKIRTKKIYGFKMCLSCGVWKIMLKEYRLTNYIPKPFLIQSEKDTNPMKS